MAQQQMVKEERSLGDLFSDELFSEGEGFDFGAEAGGFTLLVKGDTGDRLAVALDSDLLRALAYAGFLLNLINLAPIAFLDGAHVLRSWRVLRAGGGRTDPAQARRLAAVVAVASLATVAALVLGMLAAHVPQDRL